MMQWYGVQERRGEGQGKIKPKARDREGRRRRDVNGMQSSPAPSPGNRAGRVHAVARAVALATRHLRRTLAHYKGRVVRWG